MTYLKLNSCDIIIVSFETISFYFKLYHSCRLTLYLWTLKHEILAHSWFCCTVLMWEIDGGKSGNSVRLYFSGLQNHYITTDGDCGHEIKRRLLLGRKVMTNLDSIFKSRDITLPTKVHLVKAMVFPVNMYGCESWTVKKAEHQRIDAFELWCWRRLLRVP